MLNNDSSDEEGYRDTKAINQFPWLKAGYKHISDELDFTEQEKTTLMKEQYPISEMTDNKIILKPKEDDSILPPEKILIVAPNSGCLDQLLDIALQYGIQKQAIILRLGRSLSRDDLNKKFSIESLSGAT